MSDVNCPYCNDEQEIDHDDGYGYDEDRTHEQRCSKCGKDFEFTTSMSYTYTVGCQSKDHEMEPFGEKWPDMYQCKNCDFYERRSEEVKE